MKRFAKLRSWPVLIVGLVIGLAIGGTVSWAQIPDAFTSQISSCYAVSGPNKGAMRVIDYENGDRCKPGEKMLRWRQSAIEWRGQWDPEISYANHNAVMYNSAVYLSKRRNAGNVPTNTAYWALILPRGVKGATGAQGPAGAVGPAGATGPTGAQGIAGSPALLAAQPAAAVNAWELSDTAWSDLDGAATSIAVPAATSALVVARWSGVISPIAPNLSDVMLRIVVDGTPMQPYAPPETVGYGESLNFERSLTGVSAGTHDVKVQVSLPTCGCSQLVNVGSSQLVVEGAPQ